MTEKQKAEFEKKLRQVGLPAESIQVFGTIRVNVHIRTLGEDTARKWASVLAMVFPSGKLSLVRTSWDAKVNHGTCLLPTKRYGWLVGVIA